MNKPDIVEHACDLSYVQRIFRSIMDPRLIWAKSTRVYLKKNLNAEKAGGMAQVVEYLPSKHQTLSSNSSSAKL
jgi:signal recognition particle subunit SEC65